MINKNYIKLLRKKNENNSNFLFMKLLVKELLIL